MDRRTFLKSTTAAAAATTTAGAVQAQNASSKAPAIVTTRRELQITLPAESHLADAALTVMRDIEIASEGRLAFRTSETIAPNANNIASGKIDGTFGQLTEVCNAPELALFSGLPGDMALSPDDLLAWHSAAAGEMFVDEAADAYGLTAMVCGHSGSSIGLWADRTVSDLRDLATAKVATVGLGNSIIDAIRSAYDPPAGTGNPVKLTELAVAPLEAFSSLPTEHRGIWYQQGLHDQGHATMLMLSRETWNRLSAGDQLLVQSISRAAAYRDLSRVKVSNRLIAPSVFANQQMTREPLPHDISTALQHVSRQVAHDNISRNAGIEPAFQSYRAFYQAMNGMPLPPPTSGHV